MNRSKFSLADLLTLMSAITFGFLFFLGYNFLTLGDMTKSIILASSFALALGVIAYALKTLKGVSRNFKTNIIAELVLILAYSIIAFFAFSPFSHYFSVSQEKEQIQNNILTNISEAEGLFDAYDDYTDNRLSLYERKLKGIIQARIVNPSEYIEFGFVQGTSDETQLKAKLDALTYKLKPSNYSEMKDNLTWLSDSKSKVENWSPIGVVDIVNTLNKEVSSWSAKLKENSAYRQKGEEATDFEASISFDEVSTIFTEKTSPNPLGIGIGLVIYLLMLFSYLVSKRHDRIRGNVLNMLFGNSTTDNKEL
jgi:hypothetical protein